MKNVLKATSMFLASAILLVILAEIIFSFDYNLYNIVNLNTEYTIAITESLRTIVFLIACYVVFKLPEAINIISLGYFVASGLNLYYSNFTSIYQMLLVIVFGILIQFFNRIKSQREKYSTKNRAKNVLFYALIYLFPGFSILILNYLLYRKYISKKDNLENSEIIIDNRLKLVEEKNDIKDLELLRSGIREINPDSSDRLSDLDNFEFYQLILSNNYYIESTSTFAYIKYMHENIGFVIFYSKIDKFTQNELAVKYIYIKDKYKNKGFAFKTIKALVHLAGVLKQDFRIDNTEIKYTKIIKRYMK
jgi:RimJ/RimL family protein N-acetyltransferase